MLFVVEQPPKIAFGEYALPLAFELARKLRKAPRKSAEEIVAGVGSFVVDDSARWTGVRVGISECRNVTTVTPVVASNLPSPRGAGVPMGLGWVMTALIPAGWDVHCSGVTGR